MDFDEYEELLMTKTISDTFLIGIFREEFKDKKNGHKNNLPLIALYQGRYTLLASFLLKGIFNLNTKNIAGETLLTLCLKKDNSQLAIEIIDAGYTDFDTLILEKSIFDFCASRKSLYPVLFRIMSIDETGYEPPPSEFKIYEPGFFQMGEESGEGGYGLVKMAIGKDNKCYALKMSKASPKKLSYDSIREIKISRFLNNIYPKATCYIYGIYKDSKGFLYVVTEYLKHTLSAIFGIYRNVPNEIKYDFYMRLFRNITETLNMINKCGICHFDLKPENIMLDSKGYIRIIDFGISRYIGLERNSIKDYLETWIVKAPDDISEKFSYNIDGVVVFHKNEDSYYRVDYSSDMFSIGTMILGSVLSTRTKQMLITKSQAYIFYRGDNKNMEVEILKDSDRKKIDDFSPYLWDFFVRVFSTDSSLRLTCKEALDHPFFSGNEPNQTLTVPYSITDITIPEYMKNMKYTPNEITNRLHELKYLQEILDTYIPLVIPKTDSDLKEKPFKKYGDFEESILFSSGFDQYINVMMFAREFKRRKNVDITNGEITEIFIIFKSIMMGCNYAHNNTELINCILESNLVLIPFSSIIIGVTTLCRENGNRCDFITKFLNSSYGWIYKFVSSKRKSDISIGDLLDIFLSISHDEKINEESEWVRKIILE